MSWCLCTQDSLDKSSGFFFLFFCCWITHFWSKEENLTNTGIYLKPISVCFYFDVWIYDLLFWLPVYWFTLDFVSVCFIVAGFLQYPVVFPQVALFPFILAALERGNFVVCINFYQEICINLLPWLPMIKNDCTTLYKKSNAAAKSCHWTESVKLITNYFLVQRKKKSSHCLLNKLIL